MTDTDTSAAKARPRSRWLRPLMAVAGVGLAWTAVIGAWLPDWVRPRIEAAATDALGTPVALAHVRIQPWTLLVTLEGLRIGPAATPMFTLAQAQVQVSPQSLWRLAPVLSRVNLVQPEVWVERQSDRRFNVSPVLDRLNARPASPPSDEPARFAIFNIALKDGLLRYTDRVLQQEHRVEQLQVGVPFLSNLPSDIEVDVQPLLQAKVDGSPLLIKGQTRPFGQGLRSEVKLDWSAVDVPHWLAAAQPFMPEGLQALARSGRLDAALTVQFESRQPPAVPRLAVLGGLSLNKLDVSLPAVPGLGQVRTGWERLRVEGVNALPLERQVQLGLVQVDGLHWLSHMAGHTAGQASARAPDGPGQPAAPVAAAKAEASSASASAQATAMPWAWRVDKVRLSTGRLEVQTAPPAAPSAGTQAPGKVAARAGAFWPALTMLSLSVDGLDSGKQAKAASWQLALRDEHDASLQAHGHTQVAKQLVDGQLNLVDLALSPWLAPLQPSLKLPVQVAEGKLAVQAQFQARLQHASALERAQASLLSARVGVSTLRAQPSRPGLPDQIKLAALTLDGIQAQIDLDGTPALRSLTMQTLDLDQLDAALTRGADGAWMGMAPGPAAPSAPAGTPAPIKAAAKANGAPSPLVTLKTLHCRACQLQLLDQTVSPAARFELRQTMLQLSGLSADVGQAIQVELSTLAQGQGRVQFKGDVRPQPLSVQARLNVANLDMRAVQPYIDPMVNISLAAAKAQADGRLNLQMPAQGGLQARYKGRLGLSDLRVQDRVNDADVLSWRSLSLDGVDAAWSGEALDADLGRIALKDFYGRVIINPDGQLNLAGIMRQQSGAQPRSLTTPEVAGPDATSKAPAAASNAAAASAPAQVASGVASASRPKLRWQQIQLSRGRVDFTDNFIKPNYSATLTQIQGDVSAVSSTAPQPATIALSGAVDDAAPLQITGQLHPLGPQLYTDIEGSAKGIELTRLSPYASRYAGYAIDKGTLSVKVQYKVEGGKLTARNQIFLDQLTFGEKTNSPDATTLPVQFAVSLLKNSRGEIDINLPISGSLDDPQFSVGGIIWRVLVNLITKAVTAPFALLAGDGADELGFVAFEPGQAELNDAARQRLDALAAKLIDRPALKLEATGQADPLRDAEGLRQAHLESLMRSAKAKATGQAVAEVQIAPDERATWLAAAYKAADIKKPRNVIGLAKTLPPADMQALLLASAQVDQPALRALANQRGDQVKAYLASKMPPERVLLTASRLGNDPKAEDKGPATRVQFTIK